MNIKFELMGVSYIDTNAWGLDFEPNNCVNDKNYYSIKFNETKTYTTNKIYLFVLTYNHLKLLFIDETVF